MLQCAKLVESCLATTVYGEPERNRRRILQTTLDNIAEAEQYDLRACGYIDEARRCSNVEHILDRAELVGTECDVEHTTQIGCCVDGKVGVVDR